jgi:hypothetical protein
MPSALFRQVTSPQGRHGNVVDLRQAGGATEPGHPSRSEPHTVAYRASVPLLGQRYYLAFFVGSEQRSPRRVAADGQRRSFLHTTFGLSAALMFACMLVMSTLATAYLLKSLLGIDLYDGHFFLHGLFFA